MEEKINKVAIVGVGLIGGSLGMAFKNNKVANEIVGIDIDEEIIRDGVRLGTIDSGTTNLIQGVKDAELVILATPISAILKTLTDIVPHLKEGSVVSDTGSTKFEIAKKARKIIHNKIDFIPGHPMTGTEESGVKSATPYLFENAIYVLTPLQDEETEGLRLMKWVLKKIGARILIMPPDKHDRIVAVVSHLPQMLAISLLNEVTDYEEKETGFLSLAAGGFKDITRIADSPPKMWWDICLTNRKLIIEAAEECKRRLSQIQELLQERKYLLAKRDY